MKLFGNPMSTCTRKVIALFHERKAPFEMVTIDFTKGEHKQAAHLARQPFGVIPALEDGDFALYESRAILHYLDAVLPGDKLTPADPQGMARMEQWLSIEYSNFSPPAMRVVRQLLFVPRFGGTADVEIVKEGKKATGLVLDVADKHLATHDYFAGKTFSLADLSWMPYVQYLVDADAGDLVTTRPAVARWWKSVSERPSWRATIAK
jgi:glutathione S-transferase